MLQVTLDSTTGYLAVPVRPPPGPWPGVVVIHESWGLNADIWAHADRLAPPARLVRLDYKPESAEDS
jgi:dienelactone hydrolase